MVAGCVTFSLFADVSETLAFVQKADGKRTETYQSRETPSFTATIEKWHEHKVSDSYHPPQLTVSLTVSGTTRVLWGSIADIGHNLPPSLVLLGRSLTDVGF